MLTEVLWLVLLNHAMKCGGKEREEAVVLAHDTVCERTVLPGCEMAPVDIEGGKRIGTHTPDLCNIVLVRSHGARTRIHGSIIGCVFDKALVETFDVFYNDQTEFFH